MTLKKLKFLLIIFISITFAQNNYDSLITSGISQIYNIKFQDASKTFLLLKKKYPQRPAGPFMEAMTMWWEILIDMDDESKDDLFYEKIENVIDFCDEIIDTNENNSEALFFKGGALGFRGLLSSLRKNWFDAAGDGADALPLVNRVYEIDTTNIDVKLGFGIYNYFAVTIPEKYPIAKPLMLFIPEGNKIQGIKELEQVSQNGQYTSVEARYTLGKIYYLYEKNYTAAINYFKALHEEFPDNPVFERYFARVKIAKNGYRSDSGFIKIMQKCEAGKFGYTTKMKREAHYYIGMKHKSMNQPKEALLNFQKCAELSAITDKDEESGFLVNSVLYSGMMNDVLGNREKALVLYEKVLDMDEYKKAQEKAERYIKMPYKMQGKIIY